MSDPRYDAGELTRYAASLFEHAGTPPDRAQTIAALLVEADLLGHTTHGLNLAAKYLDAIAAGQLRVTGDPRVLADKGACLTWDGERLSGVWLTAHAIDTGVERARQFGSASIAIRRSHHIACLAAFLSRATDAGMMIMLSSSDPSVASVAPFGGTEPVFTPDPIAVGIPTPNDPILIDISASITTNGMSDRLKAEGRKFDHDWLLDNEGNPTNDPAVFDSTPPGTILPVGGIDHGHKGYGMALMIEALTQGLAGYGRADPPEGWGASVFVQIHDPAAFAGFDAFTRQTGHTADACRNNKPRPGVGEVRLPGQRGLARKREALEKGLGLYPGIYESLQGWASRAGVEPPAPLQPAA